MLPFGDVTLARVSYHLGMTPAEIHAHFQLQRQASREHVDVPLLVRRERLLRIQENAGRARPRARSGRAGRLRNAITAADGGGRLFVLRSLLSHTLRHLGRWMEAQESVHASGAAARHGLDCRASPWAWWA